jgi:hypothetical protein
MSQYSFHNEITLAEQAEALGRKALKLGLIPSFVVHHFPDSWQFYIPNEKISEALTPEQAYLKLKRLIEASSSATTSTQ